MKRLFGLALIATTILSSTAFAAPVRIRGTVTSVSDETLVVHTKAGKDQSITLGGNTRYEKVVKSSLSDVDQGSYIGTATKQVGGNLIALEVVVFPPAMKGTGEGHYAWDRISDTTLSGGSSTASMMTNGTVAAASSTGATTDSTMTNGNVSAADAKGGAKQLTVTYKGGKQSILVPPTAPIVSFEPGAMSDVTQGKSVFVVTNEVDGKLTAVAVNVGRDGVKPPM